MVIIVNRKQEARAGNWAAHLLLFVLVNIEFGRKMCTCPSSFYDADGFMMDIWKGGPFACSQCSTIICTSHI